MKKIKRNFKKRWEKCPRCKEFTWKQVNAEKGAFYECQNKDCELIIHANCEKTFSINRNFESQSQKEKYMREIKILREYNSKVIEISKSAPKSEEFCFNILKKYWKSDDFYNPDWSHSNIPARDFKIKSKWYEVTVTGTNFIGTEINNSFSYIEKILEKKWINYIIQHDKFDKNELNLKLINTEIYKTFSKSSLHKVNLIILQLIPYEMSIFLKENNKSFLSRISDLKNFYNFSEFEKKFEEVHKKLNNKYKISPFSEIILITNLWTNSKYINLKTLNTSTYYLIKKFY